MYDRCLGETVSSGCNRHETAAEQRGVIENVALSTTAGAKMRVDEGQIRDAPYPTGSATKTGIRRDVFA